MEENPAYIFVEASSAEIQAFPTEIYWGTLISTEGGSYLINPAGIERWANWHNDFFDIHGITENDASIYGTLPIVVCQALNQFFTNRTAYADEPSRTMRLLEELYLVAGIRPIKFEIFDLDELFLTTIKLQVSKTENAEEVLLQIKEKIAAQKAHYLIGGAFTRRYYEEIWKQIHA